MGLQVRRQRPGRQKRASPPTPKTKQKWMDSGGGDLAAHGFASAAASIPQPEKMEFLSTGRNQTVLTNCFGVLRFPLQSCTVIETKAFQVSAPVGPVY